MRSQNRPGQARPHLSGGLSIRARGLCHPTMVPSELASCPCSGRLCNVGVDKQGCIQTGPTSYMGQWRGHGAGTPWPTGGSHTHASSGSGGGRPMLHSRCWHLSRQLVEPWNLDLLQCVMSLPVLRKVQLPREFFSRPFCVRFTGHHA